MARCWAGCIAVTEHIPGLRPMSPCTALAAGGRVMPTRAWRLDGPLGWIMAVRGGIAWSLPGRSRSVRGCMPPSGGVERPGRKERFARLIHRRGRVLGRPSVRAAYGGNLRPTCLLLSVVDEATALP
jgi:hypothetical protein